MMTKSPTPKSPFRFHSTVHVLLSALVLLTFAPKNAKANEIFAAENGFGIGFVLGSPTGLSGSLPIGNNNAINAVLGYNVYGNANLHAQADYVWFVRDILPVESGKISAYYGPGAFAIASKNPSIGVRMAVGVDYRFEAAPFQVFLEIGPGIELLPATEPVFGAGLGLRYFF
jgi:hypothetical protein